MNWSGCPATKAVEAARASHAYLQLFDECQKRARDPRQPANQLDRLRGRRIAQQRAAVGLLEPIIGMGLESREGRCLLPDAIIPGHQMDTDWRAWTTISMLLTFLGARVKGLCICDSCTVVFKPSRKRRARYCSPCEKRPAPPVLGTPQNPWPSAPGDKATARVPTWEGERRTGWRVKTIGIAADAPAEPELVQDEHVFVGRADKKGSPADRKKRARRDATTSSLIPNP